MLCRDKAIRHTTKDRRPRGVSDGLEGNMRSEEPKGRSDSKAWKVAGREAKPEA